MCIITLSSTHDKFSWLIGKNPNTLIAVKSIRKGHAYGYYDDKSDNKTYVVYFDDSSNEMSYKEYHNQQFEYLNTLQYTSPVCIVNLLSEFFKSAVSIKNKDDIVCKNNLFCNLVKIEKRSIHIINKFLSYFTNVSMEIINKGLDIYTVNIFSENLYILIHFAHIIFITISCVGANDLYIDNCLTEKLVNSVCELDSPYFVRYLILSRVVHRKSYNHIKNMINISPSHSYFLHFGNTEDHRIEFIKNYFDKTQSILDFGCGEGYYVKSFAPTISSTYYAFDIDENEIKKVQNKIKLHNINNVVTLTQYDQVVKNCNNLQNLFIIVSEVIEHMEIENSTESIINLINDLQFKTMIITTPNYEFNQFYIMNTQFRHSDHKLEFTKTEFEKYFTNIVTNVNKLIKYEYIDIGDSVDNISCTQGVLITTRE